MTYSFSVLIDFDNVGNFTLAYDVSAYVKTVDIDGGIQDDLGVIANVGHCTIILDNSTRLFSPSYTSGTYYTKMVPGRPVLVQVTDGSTYTLFRGVTASFRVSTSIRGDLQATIVCVDAMDRLNNYQIALPLQQNQRSDKIAARIVNAAFGAFPASNGIKLAANPADGNTITFTLTDGSTVVYTFKSAISATGHVLIGSASTDTTNNLAAAINGGDGSGTLYFAGTTTGGEFTAASNTSNTTSATGTGGWETIGRFSGVDLAAGQILNLAAGWLSSITIEHIASVGTPSGTASYGLYALSMGLPTGSAIVSGTYTPSLGTNTITPTSTFIAAGHYALVVTSTAVQSDGNYWRWSATTPPTYFDGTTLQSQTNGASWYQLYHTAQCSVTTVSACLFTAVCAGTWGNSIAAAKVGANITLGGATFTGGNDLPEALTSYQTGIYTFDYAGDTWQASQATAFNALQELVKSEAGMVFVQRDGTVTFWNRDEVFKRVTTATSVTLSSEQQELSGGEDIEDIYNRVEVTYTPRTTLSQGIVAQTNSVITVPGQSGTQRWNGTVVLPGGGNTVVKLPFTDPTTGKAMGAKSIVTPLVPTTDWTANEASDGSSVDYTGSAVLTFSLAINGDNVEVAIRNTALGPLYVRTLKVRGVGIVRYQPVVVAREDNTSLIVYGKRVLASELPLSFTGSDTLADVLAQYLLSRYKTPSYRLRSIGFRGLYTIGVTSLFSVQIGDMVSVTDYQSGVTAAKHMVIGLSYHISGKNDTHILFYLKRMDDVTYGIYDDTTYGKYDSTMRYAL